MNLETLIAETRLPDAALIAAAEHADLRPALARGPITLAVFDAVFDPRWQVDERTAVRLLSRRLTGRSVRRILDGSCETRPTVLAALLRHNVPRRAWRKNNADLLNGMVADAALANPRWPIDEQAALVFRVPLQAALRWLLRQPSGQNLDRMVAEIEARDPAAVGEPLTHREIRAVATRFPTLAARLARSRDIATKIALAGVIDDPDVLESLTDLAVRTTDAIHGSALIEALWCNPSLPSADRRRLRQRCSRNTGLQLPYLRPSDPPPHVDIRQADDRQLARLMDWTERNVKARHTVTWTAVRILRHAAHTSPATHQRACEFVARNGVAADVDAAVAPETGLTTPAESSRDAAAVVWPRRRRSHFGDTLTAAFASDRERWDLAIVLMRDEWPESPDELIEIVHGLLLPMAAA